MISDNVADARCRVDAALRLLHEIRQPSPSNPAIVILLEDALRLLTEEPK